MISASGDCLDWNEEVLVNDDDDDDHIFLFCSVLFFFRIRNQRKLRQVLPRGFPLFDPIFRFGWNRFGSDKAITPAASLSDRFRLSGAFGLMTGDEGC